MNIYKKHFSGDPVLYSLYTARDSPYLEGVEGGRVVDVARERGGLGADDGRLVAGFLLQGSATAAQAAHLTLLVR